MKNIVRARKGTSSVFAALMMIIITLVSGIAFCTFVTSNINYAQDKFTTQMTSLILKTFKINSTHITAWIQNTGTKLTKITSAYVNGLIATIINTVQIEPSSTTMTCIKGTFTKGNIYTVKLLSLFSTAATFDITY